VDGPKVNNSLALVKLGYMLENLSIPHYSSEKGSDNVMGADDQQERPKATQEGRQLPSRILGTILIWISIVGFFLGTTIITVLVYYFYGTR
jgi:hypothetical protein